MMWLDDHSYPVLQYIKALLCALLFIEQPKSLLNLGLGSGAIERYLLSHHPDVQMVSVEPETDMISLSKECFCLNRDYPVLDTSAQKFLDRNRKRFDIVICDIHPKESAINPIKTVHFLQGIENATTSRGIVAINFLPEDEDEIVSMLVKLRQVFSHVSLYDVPHQQNLVLYCANAQFPTYDELIARTKLAKHIHLQAETICSNLLWLPVGPSG
jgi:spermidine synthase